MHWIVSVDDLCLKQPAVVQWGAKAKSHRVQTNGVQEVSVSMCAQNQEIKDLQEKVVRYFCGRPSNFSAEDGLSTAVKAFSWPWRSLWAWIQS
jgi:hypothetical protein